MSITHIESDYTPKDFLERLLGKTIKPEPLLVEDTKPSNEGSNSQSTIQSNSLAEILSPRSSTIRRVHFQSVQNIQSPQRRQSEVVKIEQKGGFQFKENLKKKPLNKQPKQNLYTKDQNPSFSNVFNNKAQTQINNLTKTKYDTQIETEEKLILHKTKLILKSILKSKIQQSEIGSILNSLESGIQDAAQFDRLIASSSIQSSENHLQISKISQKTAKRQSIKSRSVQNLKITSLTSQRRAKSFQKQQCKILTKKQKKQVLQQSKMQILKSIKKMKQLVFLNQKSLKRTKRQ